MTKKEILNHIHAEWGGLNTDYLVEAIKSLTDAQEPPRWIPCKARMAKTLGRHVLYRYPDGSAGVLWSQEVTHYAIVEILLPADAPVIAELKALVDPQHGQTKVFGEVVVPLSKVLEIVQRRFEEVK